MSFEIIPAYSCPEEVRRLFTEYTSQLITGYPEFLKYLQLQNYDEKIADLEYTYGPPVFSFPGSCHYHVRQMGFREISRYNDSPMDSKIYMAPKL